MTATDLLLLVFAGGAVLLLIVAFLAGIRRLACHCSVCSLHRAGRVVDLNFTPSGDAFAHGSGDECWCEPLPMKHRYEGFGAVYLHRTVLKR